MISVSTFVSVKMAQTRSATEDPIVGQPARLPSTQLPSKLDILKAYLYKLSHFSESERDDKVKSSIVSELVQQITNIWKLASIPTNNEDLVKKSVSYLIKKHSTFFHSLNRNRNNEDKIAKFCLDSSELFDISSCRCFHPKFGKKVDWNTIKLSGCFCDSEESKIPESEFEFYVDQHLERKLFIANSVDKVTTEKIRKRQLQLNKRKEREERKRARFSVPELPAVVKPTESQLEVENAVLIAPAPGNNSFISSDESEYDADDDFKKEAVQNRNEYPNLIAAARRFNVSNRAVCAIGNAMLADLG